MFIKDEGVKMLVLVRKKGKINFRSCFFFKKETIQQLNLEKQFTSCYSKYIPSESYNH